MPRPRHIDPPTRLELKLPQSLRSQLDEHLFSPLEGRVPYSSYTLFFVALLQDYFSSKKGNPDA